MLDIKTLLPELKKLVTDLSEDLLARSTAKNDPYSAKVDTGLREAYAQIEKGGRTADAFEVWREDYLDQVAVAWVLGCVFVRFMEDNHLIDECWLAGEGERRKLAEDTHELYFREHPHDSDREYFEHVFHEVGKIPACRDLFAEGKTPLWAVGPSGDMAMKLLAFWREVVPETGELQRSFEVEDGDTRFLGDLYQDLSERARKKYALLQTPVFVEEFILDRTLNPAIDEFGLDEVRMIDPTCGSGHFLLGSFARLFDLWIKREDNEVVAAQKALDGVWGCDINPFAVAIARFRLIVAALRACGIKRLKGAPAWNIHLATGDSLLFGSRWDREGKKKSEQQFLGTAEESWAPEIYACEDKEAISEVLGQQYHAVVGNPPYIIVRDRSLNQAYRDRYATCHQKYSLAVPFAERFVDLAVAAQNGTQSGYVGTITANSFMKREFGKKLIESFFQTIDLTHVIDSSGAFIPGHGTPTVILFIRNRPPTLDTVRAVLGVQGEPSTPDDPAHGLVWQSIVANVDRLSSDDAFVTSTDIARATFGSHPWSLGGGGAAELKEQIEEKAAVTLRDMIADVGFMTISGEDDAFVAPPHVLSRRGIPFRPFCTGEIIRDWTYSPETAIAFPYDDSEDSLPPLKASDHQSLLQFFWPNRTTLRSRNMFGKTPEEHGLEWYAYMQFIRGRARAPLALAFAEVASHNHFILDRGGNSFKQTAPMIALPEQATEKDHLRLLGYLNSSLACFWIKQVAHQKQMTGGDGVRIQCRSKVPYQLSGTQLQQLPVADELKGGVLGDRVAAIAERIDESCREVGNLNAHAVVKRAIAESLPIEAAWESAKLQREKHRSRAIFLQEELDFTVYVVYGLADESLLLDELEWPDLALHAGERPFEILRQESDDGHVVPSGIPKHWPEPIRAMWSRRCDAITSSKELKLIEDAHYKRRWIGRQGLFNHARVENELGDACWEWLIERLDSPTYWNNEENGQKLQTVSELAETVGVDEQFREVATVYRGRADFDVPAMVTELVTSEAVPFLPSLYLKSSGLRKRQLWERTWERQRQEDSKVSSLPPEVPPKYTAGDFQRTEYSRLRGGLDVPKERWISFPHCETESDPSLVVGWAGWNHLQQATALIAYYDARKREGWDAKRLTPLLAGLDQLLPWIHQWHPEIDPEFGETAGQSFETMLKADAHELGLTLEDIRAWEPPKKTTTRRKRTTK